MTDENKKGDLVDNPAHLPADFPDVLKKMPAAQVPGAEYTRADVESIVSEAVARALTVTATPGAQPMPPKHKTPCPVWEAMYLNSDKDIIMFLPNGGALYQHRGRLLKLGAYLDGLTRDMLPGFPWDLQAVGESAQGGPWPVEIPRWVPLYHGVETEEIMIIEGWGVMFKTVSDTSGVLIPIKNMRRSDIPSVPWSIG